MGIQHLILFLCAVNFRLTSVQPGKPAKNYEASNTKREQLQIAQKRNADKSGNLYEKHVIKRETNNSNANPYERDFEDKFIDYFGNELYEFRCWDKIRAWYYWKSFPNLDMGPVMRFCEAAHLAAGRGNVTVDRVILRSRELCFTKPHHVTRRVDVLSYGVKGVTRETISHGEVDDYWYMEEGEHGYIIEGRSDDCVYYLNLLSRTSMMFSLSRYVCGIKA